MISWNTTLSKAPHQRMMFRVGRDEEVPSRVCALGLSFLTAALATSPEAKGCTVLLKSLTPNLYLLG